MYRELAIVPSINLVFDSRKVMTRVPSLLDLVELPLEE